jgi:hypothetical protein
MPHQRQSHINLRKYMSHIIGGLLFVLVSPANAENALDRVLAFIGNGSEAADFDQILLNITENSEPVGSEDVLSTVDGTITVVIYSPETPRRTTDDDAEADTDLIQQELPLVDLNLKTVGIAANNTGVIRANVNTSLYDQRAAPGNILAVNAAMNTNSIMAGVRVIADPSVEKNTGKLTTTAIGAVNTGSIFISIGPDD